MNDQQPAQQPEQPRLLVSSPPEHVATLHRGVVVVLTTVILALLMGFAFGFIGGFRAVNGGTVSTELQLVGASIGIVLSLATVYGWWLLTTLEASGVATTRTEKWGDIVRVLVTISVVFAVIALVSAIIEHTSTTQSMGAILSYLDIANTVGSLVFAIVVWIAQMLFIRDVALRLPNEQVVRRAKLLAWLGPVLNTFGLLLLGLGPLIALVMYWNMLDKVRKDLKAIRAEQAMMG